MSIATDKTLVSKITEAKKSVVKMHGCCLQQTFSMGCPISQHLPYMHHGNCWLLSGGTSLGCPGCISDQANSMLLRLLNTWQINTRHCSTMSPSANS